MQSHQAGSYQQEKGPYPQSSFAFKPVMVKVNILLDGYLLATKTARYTT